MTYKKSHNLSAVSCAELPRADADLFYQIICWYHYQFLGVNGQNRILDMPEQPDYKSLRQNGQLSDLANLISRDLFQNYRFRFNYAEDLDLGIRLIRAGHSLGFMGKTRIIHSHNRSAYYFFKRGYVDNLFLSKIFGDDFPLTQIDFPSSVADFGFTLSIFCNQLRCQYNQLELPLNPQSWQKAVCEMLKNAQDIIYPSIEDLTDLNGIELELSTLLDKLVSVAGYEKSGSLYEGQIIPNMLGFIKITTDYIKEVNVTIDQQTAEELLNALLKNIALSSGAHLAHCYLRSTGREKEKMLTIHKFLQESI